MLRRLPVKSSLRLRIVLCCAALGCVVGVCLAIVADMLSERNELLLVNEEMSAEIAAQIVHYSIAHHDSSEDANLPRSAWKSLYIDRPGRMPTSPPAFRGLAPGVHELNVTDSSDRFVAIRNVPIGRITMVAGLPNSPARERLFLEEMVAMVGLGTLLGALLGRLLANRMLAPVLRLSREVDHPGHPDDLQRIADEHRRDEVGALADALARYRSRLHQAMEREILFSADASHELRTPLTVLQGALEIIEESPGPESPARQRQLVRMRRSASEMATLLDAFLLLLRTPETTGATRSPVEMSHALRDVVAEFRDELDAAQVTLRIRCDATLQVLERPGLLETALRLLFRAIVNGGFGCRLQLDVNENGLALSASEPFADAGAEACESGAVQGAVQRSDLMGGVGMLRRLCERHGWCLVAPHRHPDGTLLRILFDPSSACGDEQSRTAPMSADRPLGTLEGRDEACAMPFRHGLGDRVGPMPLSIIPRAGDDAP